MSKAVTQDDFEQEVVQSKGLVIVDFWAGWCPPCRALGPILESVEKDAKGKVVVAKVDVDANQQLAQEHGVQSLPTVKLYKDGQEVETWVGLLPKQSYVDMVEKYAAA